MERDHSYDPAPVGRPRQEPAPASRAGNPWPGPERTQRFRPPAVSYPSRISNLLPRRAQRRQTLALAGLLASAALVSAACTGNHRPATPANGAGSAFSRGMASWYGPKFHGRRTASGERYDMHELTAAHPSLPFGTLLQVTNVENGRQVVVRINDRGPFGRRRIIDLSYAAARQLAMIGPGTAEVELAILNRAEPAPPPPMQPILLAAIQSAPPEPLVPPDASGAGAAEVGAVASRGLPQAAFTVQVGAFGEVDRADALQQSLARLYPEAVVHSDGTWHRVHVGLFGDRELAEGMRRELAALGLEAVVVAAR
jgi:rare lipoprotein A (peptidoglycan hydrolase)